MIMERVKGEIASVDRASHGTGVESYCLLVFLDLNGTLWNLMLFGYFFLII